jgi:aminoglycoside phosphotransferase (APT) family kinase protein
VPVAPVVWSGDDERWFGRPYFIAERIEGDTLRAEDNPDISEHDLVEMSRQAVVALAELHKLDWTRYVPDDGPPMQLAPDIERWDRFAERAAEPQMMELQPAVKQLLMEKLPAEPHMGISHGDSQWTNFLYKPDKNLGAIVDWELWNVGATLNDLGWLCTFADRGAWADDAPRQLPVPSPEFLVDVYVETMGEDPGNIDWYRAAAAYKFAIITGLNLSLHRRGKRHDPHWEELKDSANTLLARAQELLT